MLGRALGLCWAQLKVSDRDPHRRMGTLWLGGGGGGVDCPKFYTDNRRGYRISWRGGFHNHPPPWTLSAWRHSPSGKLKNTPTRGHSQSPPPPPWTLSAWRHPPSGILKNTPVPPLLLPQKRTAAAQKTELPKSWGGGGCSPPPPRLIRLWGPPPPKKSFTLFRTLTHTINHSTESTHTFSLTALCSTTHTINHSTHRFMFDHNAGPISPFCPYTRSKEAALSLPLPRLYTVVYELVAVYCRRRSVLLEPMSIETLSVSLGSLPKECGNICIPCRIHIIKPRRPSTPHVSSESPTRPSGP